MTAPIKCDPDIAMTLAKSLIETILSSGVNRYEAEAALKTTQAMLPIVKLRDESCFGGASVGVFG